MTNVSARRHFGHFDPTGLDDLPPAARRWLVHAIEPGAPLYRQLTLTMHGELKLGRWRPFVAEQSLEPGRSFRWSARTSIAGLPVTGFDRYSHGAGEMRWRLLGLVPVMSAQGGDVTLSAAGRLAAEAALLPSSLVEARWEHVDATRSAFTTTIDSTPHRVVIEVDADGTLRRIVMRRWGKPAGASTYNFHQFAVQVESESRHEGQLLASRFVASWPDRRAPDGGDFFRAEIDTVRLA